MNNHVINLAEFESFSLRIAPGEYQTFPVVDNKGLFSHFRKTDETFIYNFQAYQTENGSVVGIYKKVGCFAILVCAFSSHKEINAEAKGIIQSNAIIRNSLEGLLEY